MWPSFLGEKASGSIMYETALRPSKTDTKEEEEDKKSGENVRPSARSIEKWRRRHFLCPRSSRNSNGRRWWRYRVQRVLFSRSNKQHYWSSWHMCRSRYKRCGCATRFGTCRLCQFLEIMKKKKRLENCYTAQPANCLHPEGYCRRRRLFPSSSSSASISSMPKYRQRQNVVQLFPPIKKKKKNISKVCIL